MFYRTLLVIPNNKHTHILIVYSSLDFKYPKDINQKCSWPKPDNCPSCKGLRLWNHGYVLRYFDQEQLFTIKYRCPDCKSVHTLRPSNYYRKFLTPIKVILKSLKEKIENKRWLCGMGYQKQQYWYQGFRIQSARHSKSLEDSLLSLEGKVPPCLILSTHSLIYFEIKPLFPSLHLIFAVTPGSGYG